VANQYACIPITESDRASNSPSFGDGVVPVIDKTGKIIDAF